MSLNSENEGLFWTLMAERESLQWYLGTLKEQTQHSGTISKVQIAKNWKKPQNIPGLWKSGWY